MAVDIFCFQAGVMVEPGDVSQDTPFACPEAPDSQTG